MNVRTSSELLAILLSAKTRAIDTVTVHMWRMGLTFSSDINYSIPTRANLHSHILLSFFSPYF